MKKLTDKALLKAAKKGTLYESGSVYGKRIKGKVYK